MNANRLPRKPLVLVSALLLSGMGLLACSVDSEPTQSEPTRIAETESRSGLPPIRRFLSCLPEEAALVAAHRGTGEGLGAPENSLSGLNALIDQGILMAEIDIAKIKDGTLISYHDGVWDDKSSGRGPVVATTATDFARIRLKDVNGSIGGEAVPTLAEMLDTAKGRLYLEIDFKTSADIDRVIAEIKARDMVDQVVLIAITDAEADILKPFAEEFVLSLPRSSALPDQGVWVGGAWRDGALTGLPHQAIRIGSQWRTDGPSGAKPLDILVTDEITAFEPIAGLTDKRAFESCLKG